MYGDQRYRPLLGVERIGVETLFTKEVEAAEVGVLEDTP